MSKSKQLFFYVMEKSGELYEVCWMAGGSKYEIQTELNSLKKQYPDAKEIFYTKGAPVMNPTIGHPSHLTA